MGHEYWKIGDLEISGIYFILKGNAKKKKIKKKKK